MAAANDTGLPIAQQSFANPGKPKQTCAQCRARKVKCDGRVSFCSNCERLGYECSFRASSAEAYRLGAASTPSALPSRPPKGRRVARACAECHLAKSRCTGALPTCQRCTARSLHCVYEPRASGHRQQAESRSPPPEPSPSSVGTRSQDDQRLPKSVGPPISPAYNMFDDPATISTDSGPSSYQQQYPLLTRGRVAPALRKFFEHLHCLPSLAFLHRPSIMRLYHTQEADPALISSIVAVSSRLPGTGPEESSIGFRCAEVTESLVSMTLKQPSFFRLQALLLLLRFRLWTGSTNDPLMLMSYLARSALLLKLNYETFRPSSFVQESRRRLVWAIYMLDVSLADGLSEYSTLPINTIHLRLPCMEDDFELDTDTLSERVNPAGNVTGWRLGIIGYYIRIVHLNDQILRYIKRLINTKSEPNAAEFLKFEEDLSDFQARLPGHERYSHKTLALRAFSPRLARFVMTHVWWHVCHCQLFRPLLSTIPQTYSPKLATALGEVLVVEYQKKCLEYAIQAVSILSALQTLDTEIYVLDVDMAECAFKLSEIMLLSSEEIKGHLGITQAVIVQHVSVCLRFSESLLEMYPTVKPIVVDLASALSSFTKGEPCFANVIVQQTSPRQAITRHSALQRASFADDSNKLEITNSSGDQTPNIASPGRLSGLQTTPSTTLAAYNLGSLTGIDMNLSTGQPEETFLWQGEVPDIWDQISLFRGPFDSGELDEHETGG